MFSFFPLFSSNIQDIEGDDIQRDLRKSTMGIYVINKEGGEIGAHDDIGIYVEGVIILDNIGSVVQACAMRLTPKTMKNTFNFIQRVMLGLGENKLPPKLQTLKNLLLS
uniref:Uncharacterized protein n=1 Tax=Sander lucioperca TaxID=283035 RepID=A0A8D0A5E2_SANLU